MEEQNFAQILSAQQSVGDCLLATVLEGPDQGRQLLLGGRQTWARVIRLLTFW